MRPPVADPLQPRCEHDKFIPGKRSVISLTALRAANQWEAAVEKYDSF